MLASAKRKQQKQFRQLQCQEQCNDHIPYYLSGLSRARFFQQPFSKQLYMTRHASCCVSSGRVRSQGVETSGVERSSCDARVWVLPKRQNKMADIILDRQRDYPADVSHYPVAFICCKQQRRNKLFFLTFVFCFVQFFPREQISVLNIVPPP